MSEQRSLRAELIQRWACHLPNRPLDSTVSIVVASQGAVFQLGTGILFQVADTYFVVTAAHVLEEPHRWGRTIGISGADRNFIATGGTWVASVPEAEGSPDPLDVAVYCLPEAARERLRGKRFLRASDVDFGSPPRMALYSLCGFPGAWSLPSRRPDEEVRLGPLEYVGSSYDQTPNGLVGFDPHYHILIDARSDYLTTPDGYETDFTGRTGESLPLKVALKGVSGAAVWCVGDLDIPVEQWGRTGPRVVAVQTGVYSESEVIRATKWAAVATLIHNAFPELRPSIALWPD